MRRTGLTVVVDGEEYPLCGCCLDVPAGCLRARHFGLVCDECLVSLEDAEDALADQGLFLCQPLGPDHNVGGDQ